MISAILFIVVICLVFEVLLDVEFELYVGRVAFKRWPRRRFERRRRRNRLLIRKRGFLRFIDKGNIGITIRAR